MAEIKSQETQREFFQEFSARAGKGERLSSVPKNIKPILVNTSTEQLILAGIVSILVLCLVFFLGMLRGRTLSSVREVRVMPSSPVVAVPRASLESETAPTSSVGRPASPARFAEATAGRAGRHDPLKPYTIQLVTYKKQEFAKREISSLQKKGYYATLIPSGEYYQVCVGLYRTIEEAKNDLRLFGTFYKDCYLRRR